MSERVLKVTAMRHSGYIGLTWNTTFKALKRSTSSADDDGGPALTTALFGGLRRAKTKKAAPTPVAEQATQPVTQPAAPPAPVA